MRDYTPKIPKAELKHGAYYAGECRNARYARWNAEHNCFYHWRYKFGFTFVEGIQCPEDDKYFDVFVAEALLETPEEEIPFPEKAKEFFKLPEVEAKDWDKVIDVVVESPPILNERSIPPALNGCSCHCHTTPGVYHIMPCCYPALGDDK